MMEKGNILRDAGLFGRKGLSGLYGYMLCGMIAAVTSCSTTANLPAGEILYTGIADIHITDKDSITVDDELLDRIESAFACPPNNALLGSSSTRTPVPLGLWVYNANVNRKGAFHRWTMKQLAAKPVLISSVRPETRVLIVRNILRDNGYFGNTTGYEIIPDKKDSLKAKVRYEVTLNDPYVIDSIEWRRMQHRGDTLLRLNEAERLVNAGDLFGTGKLDAERQRIAALMRNNGYYYFRPEYIVYQADSTLSPHKVSLRAGLKQGVPRSVLHPWKVGDISVHLRGYDNERPTDSVYYKDLLICYEGKLRVRPSVLYDQLQFGKGDLYSLAKQAETQTAINRLDIFRFTEFQYAPKDTTLACDTMNVRINTLYDYPLNGVFEVRATVNDNNYAGPGASLNLTRRNAFGGGEVLTASIYGAYEWNTGAKNIRNTGVINNYGTGIKGNIQFPRLVLPQIGKRAYDFSASTYLDFDIGVLNRAKYYTMLRFEGSLSYEFVPNPIRRHVFTPFRLAFNRLQETTRDFDSIVAFNPSLSQSLENQFIPSIGYSYTLDNSSVREERNKTWWRFTVSEAGNLVSGIYALFGRKPGKQNAIFGNPYAQFLKATTELRYNYYIDRNQRLAMRIGGGIIYSYGNSEVAPWNERFYAGGANSIRAFTIRGIGPGRFRPDPENVYAYIDQNGDWKLEGNIEYRGRLVGDLDIAIFLDAGNVWLLRSDKTRPGGIFEWKHFLNDIALGTGLGFRYDMDMLVFRFDVGYALHFPYDTGSANVSSRKKYFNSPSFWDSIGLHIALGYPF
ncbi:MAG: BamA/TamA family outer membrane protein [Tannerella sp.]|nr:BamA/TamA family outer membrane protein [Tannerella sp.]